MSVKAGIAASWAAHAVTLLVGFFLVPFVLGRLGDEGYGVWVFVNSLAGYSGVLYLGFGPTVCRYVAHHRARGEWDEVNRVVCSVAAVYLVSGLVVLLLAAGFAVTAPALDRWGATPVRDVQVASVLLGLNMMVGMVGSVFGGVLHAARRFDLVSAVEGLMALVRLGLTVGFLQRQQGLVILAGVFLAVTILENTLTAWLAHREVPTLSVRRRWIARRVLKECFSFSAFTALRWAAVRLIYMTDTVVIGLVLGAKAIVPYYLASRLVQMIHQPLEKIGDVVMPSAGACFARGQVDELQRLLTRGMHLALVLAGGFWVGAAYFGERLLMTWTGESYPESGLILLILLAGQVVAQPMLVMRQVLTAMGRVKLQAAFDVGQALANLGLSLVLIRIVGIVGVAWGTLIPMVLIDLGLLLPCSLRIVGLPLRAVLQRVLLPAVLPLACLWAYCEFVTRWPLREGWPSLLLVTVGGGVVLVVACGVIAGLERLSTRIADREPVSAEVTA